MTPQERELEARAARAQARSRLVAGVIYALPDLPSGVWRHYKGPLYLVFGYGHDANAADLFALDPTGRMEGPLGERTVVVYVGLELDGAHSGARLAVRTAADFHAVVCAGDPSCRNYGREVSFRADSCAHCGTPTRQRFTYVSPTWEGQR